MNSPITSGCGERDEPIVCTLGVNDQRLRASEFRAVFAHLIATEPFQGGFRWKFRAEHDIEAQLASLAVREHACCRFFDFRIFNAGDTVIWETRADERAASVLDELMKLPSTLSSNPDPSDLKHIFSAAGLPFVNFEEPAR